MGGQRAEAWWAREACHRFGIEGRLRRVATGMDTTYMLQTYEGDRFAVRVGALPIRTPDALRAECEWLIRLGRLDAIRVPQVLETAEGDRVIEVRDGDRSRPAMVLTWLPGRKMRWRFAPHHAARLGAAAAALHSDAAGHPISRSNVKGWQDRLCGVGDMDALAAVAGPDAATTVAAIHSAVVAACGDLESTGAGGLINGDLGPHNVNWLRGDHRPGLFDFNDSGWGPFAFDLARYLHSLRWRDNGDALVSAALEGYKTVAPLPVGWSEHGELFEAASGVFLARYLAPQIESRGPETAEVIRRLLRRARAVAA